MGQISIVFIVSALLGLQLGCASPVPQDTALAVQDIESTNSVDESILLKPQEIDADTLKTLDKAKLLLRNVLKDEAITAVHTDVMENYTKNLTAIVALMDNYKCDPNSNELCDISLVFGEFIHAMECLSSTDVEQPSAELVLLEKTLKKYGVEELENDIESICMRIIALTISEFTKWLNTLLHDKS